MASSTTPIPTAVGRPATRAFESAGYRTIEDISGASERALLALHEVGPRAIKILREHGVTLTP
jgi:predicted Fe-Mo cluster-binding NifX family protein